MIILEELVANPRPRMNKFVMGVSILVEKECRMTMLFNDMDISRLMVYAQQIEKSKIREIRQEGKRPRFDESSQPKPKKSFYHQGSSMGNNDRAPYQNSQGGGHIFERPRCATCRSNNRVSFLLERIVALHVLVRITR